MLIELVIGLEALEHVVAGIEALHATVHHAVETGWGCHLDPLVAIQCLQE